MDRWSRISEKPFRFALSISNDIQIVHVDSADVDHGDEELASIWQENILVPCAQAGLPDPKLSGSSRPSAPFSCRCSITSSPKSSVHENRHIAVLVPELVVRHWWENLLHNQRSSLLKLLLLVRGNQRIVVINIPWYPGIAATIKVEAACGCLRKNINDYMTNQLQGEGLALDREPLQCLWLQDGEGGPADRNQLVALQSDPARA